MCAPIFSVSSRGHPCWLCQRSWSGEERTHRDGAAVLDVFTGNENNDCGAAPTTETISYEKSGQDCVCCVEQRDVLVVIAWLLTFPFLWMWTMLTSLNCWGTVHLMAGKLWTIPRKTFIALQFLKTQEVPCSSLFRKQENLSAYSADL